LALGIKAGWHRGFPLARFKAHQGKLGWQVQNCTPLHALQELGGWETADMVRRYAHLAAEHLAPYADRLTALRVVGSDLEVTNLAQPEKQRG